MMTSSLRRLAAVVAAALLTPLASAIAAADERRPMSVEWIYSDDGDAAPRLPRFAFTAANDVLLLDRQAPKGERTIVRVRADGSRRPALDRRAALASLAGLGVAGEPLEAVSWPDSLDRDGRVGVYAIDGDLYALDLAGSRFTRLTATPDEESLPRLSPDGRRLAFVRHNDLYVLELSSRAERRLTSDGGPTVLNGKPSWVYWEEVFDRSDEGAWWSEDSSALAFLRTDESAVSVASFPGFAGAQPAVVTQRYPKVGEANPVVKVGIVEVASGRTVFMEPASYEYVLGVTWLPRSDAIAVQATNRAQTRLDVWRVARADGVATRLLSDTDEAWVNQKELQPLAGGEELLVSSERSGYTHLYRACKTRYWTPVTSGAWAVRGPGSFYGAPLGSAFVDEKAGAVYYTSVETSPVERQLYRIKLDGTGKTRITGERGVHQVTFSADRSLFVDVHSTLSTPPTVTLREAAGGAVKAVLFQGRGDLLKSFALATPELTTIPAADGFPLPATILRPAGLEPGRRVPVIVNVYGGPGAPIVSDGWNWSLLFDNVLASRGYAVVRFDNRSATATSKTLENKVARNVWSAGELDDFVAGIRWLKAQPWVDPERIGMWGWSGGGSSTLLVMTRSKELKAGIAVAPNTEWRYYDTKFSEAYMKTPADNPEGYEAASLVRHAKDLHGRLLLVHGGGDDNVHPQHAWHVVDELVKAGKPFDLMIYPTRKHGIGDRPARLHLFHKMLEFWKLYL